MISYDEIVRVINNNLEVSYKLLTISKFRILGEEKIQVHCDKHDCMYSGLYPKNKAYLAVSKFMEIRAAYMLSEIKDKENLEKIYGIS